LGREVVEMSQAISPATNRPYGLKRVCATWGIARSTIYRHIQKKGVRSKRGVKPAVSEEELLKGIREDIGKSPFKGEGHRKIHARLKREGVRSGRNRILRLMRENQLLSPHRSLYRPPDPHEGCIITNHPDVMWGSDGTKILTIEEGLVWIFSVAEHWNTECLGWHVCKTGDRFAALEPVAEAVKGIYGSLEKGVASGLKLRIDNGSQYTSDYFLQQIKHWGVEASFAIVKQPETNGVAERFHRTLKDQILDGRIFRNLDEVREAVRQFVGIYNEKWLVEKLGYQSPFEARRSHNRLKGVA
jgi:Transposase and inactivated derivatives